MRDPFAAALADALCVDARQRRLRPRGHARATGGSLVPSAFEDFAAAVLA